MTRAGNLLRYLFQSTFVLVALAENSLLMTSEDFSQTGKTAECVLKLSAKYFVEKKALSGSIVIININSYMSSTQRLLLQTIHGGIKYSVMVKDSSFRHANASHFPEKAKNYLLILEDKSELTRNILQLDKLPSWNPMAKAVVFYRLRPGENGNNISMDFINELRHFKLLMSIIFIHDPLQNEVVSYSWTPYTATNCANNCNSVYMLDLCKENFFVEIEELRSMFPSDMNGCPLRVQAMVAEPYVMSPTKKLFNKNNMDVYDFDKGGEVNLVKIIGEFTNMTLYMFLADNEEEWGGVDVNGTATGALGLLKNDSVDLMIGNIEVTKILRKWFHPTVSYTQDEMTWCVPRAKKAATWDNLVIIFQWPTWVATVISLVVMGCIFHFLYSIENKGTTKWPSKSLLITLNMLLGWTSSFNPKSTTFKILIFTWICFSLNMGICYESLLRSFLIHPRYEKQISNEMDILRSGLTFGGSAHFRPYFQANNSTLPILYKKYNLTTYSEGIKRVALQRNFAIVSSRQQAAYQDQRLGKGKRLVYCFPERSNLYKYGVVLLARKWFPILQRFNSIIRSVTENGLIEKWNKELFIHRDSPDGVGEILPLSIEHLLGAFAFIGIMYGISTLVFICEVIWGLIDGSGRVSKHMQVCASIEKKIKV